MSLTETTRNLKVGNNIRVTFAGRHGADETKTVRVASTVVVPMPYTDDTIMVVATGKGVLIADSAVYWKNARGEMCVVRSLSVNA